MTVELFIALFTMLGAVVFNFFMVARWTKEIESRICRSDERIDRLFERDDRLFSELKEIRDSIHSIEKWISREEGRNESSPSK